LAVLASEVKEKKNNMQEMTDSYRAAIFDRSYSN